MKTIPALLALSAFYSIAIVLSPLESKAFTYELETIEKKIESIGVKVIWIRDNVKISNILNCSNRLYGAYIPDLNVVYICQGAHQKDYLELLGTLKHEGWHAAQMNCNRGKPVLAKEKILASLKKSQIKVLHQYAPSKIELEAEARVIEQVPFRSWLRGFDHYCNIR